MSWYRAPLWDLQPDITSCWNVTVWNGSAICSVITQWSESLRTHNHTLLSYLRLPQPGGPGSHIYIPQERGGPVIPLGNGFPLRCCLRFTSYDSQGYGGGILTLPQLGGPGPHIYILQKHDGPVQSQSHVTTDSGYYPSSCLWFKTQLNSIGLSIPLLWAKQVNAIYRFATMVY
jgi:hypothetical protein